MVECEAMRAQHAVGGWNCLVHIKAESVVRGNSRIVRIDRDKRVCKSHSTTRRMPHSPAEMKCSSTVVVFGGKMQEEGKLCRSGRRKPLKENEAHYLLVHWCEK